MLGVLLLVVTLVAVLAYASAAARDVGRGVRWFVLGGIATSFIAGGAVAYLRDGSATLLLVILLSISGYSLVLGRGHPTRLMDLEKQGVPPYRHQTALQLILIALCCATVIPTAILVGVIN